MVAISRSARDARSGLFVSTLLHAALVWHVTGGLLQRPIVLHPQAPPQRRELLAREHRGKPLLDLLLRIPIHPLRVDAGVPPHLPPHVIQGTDVEGPQQPAREHDAHAGHVQRRQAQGFGSLHGAVDLDRRAVARLVELGHHGLVAAHDRPARDGRREEEEPGAGSKETQLAPRALGEEHGLRAGRGGSSRGGSGLWFGHGGGLPKGHLGGVFAEAERWQQAKGGPYSRSDQRLDIEGLESCAAE